MFSLKIRRVLIFWFVGLYTHMYNVKIFVRKFNENEFENPLPKYRKQ